ncbi:MAG: ABC transporter permease [Rhodobacteraceae bacterium]|nr:ABC transporter permease [Paracoccaceae bacterium]
MWSSSSPSSCGCSAPSAFWATCPESALAAEAADDPPETIPLTGPVTLASMAETRKRLGEGPDSAVIDLSGVTALDTAGAWLVARRQRASAGTDQSTGYTGASPAQTLLLQTVGAAISRVQPDAAPHRPRKSAVDLLVMLGKAVSGIAGGLCNALGFLGLVVARLARTAAHPSRLRVTALVHHMHQAGLNAVPIVALMGFLIGIVLAFQGAAQLRQFGAEVFVVDLIAISILRELGILLTAIIVAGRSASAFTASIGAMKMREEIDAMRVLGLDPIELLVLPRVLALLILLPVLGFIANMAGLLGGGLMAWTQLGISPGMFRTQLLANTDVSHLLIGLSKAPVFALIIGLVGCHQGLQVAGNSESLGSRTSRSVVMAIFLVIVVDALFSVFFSVWGI